MNGNRKNAAGFTLIEIMVVIAILVILIAILIPSLSAARNYTKKTATTAQMHGIATACESYYQNFQAYPGVLSDSAYDVGATVVPFSSSQAMLVSLGRAFATAAPASPPPSYTGVIASPVANVPAPFYTCDNPSITPMDYSVGGGHPYDAMLSPSPAQLSPAIGLLANTTAKTTDVPVIVDSAYGPQALPILYYRAARKYDPSVQNSKNQNMNAVGDSATTGGTAPFAAFYSASNDWLFAQQTKTFASPLPTPSATFLNAGSLTATDAVQSTTAAGTDIGNLGSPNADAMQAALFNSFGSGVGTTSLVPKGAFVLISAGQDRVYGPRSNLDKTKNPNYSAGSTTADDIIIGGGN